MWRYDNVKFIYSNPVDSVYNQEYTFSQIFTYRKSKFALIEALNIMVQESYIGVFAEINNKTIKYNKPIKV